MKKIRLNLSKLEQKKSLLEGSVSLKSLCLSGPGCFGIEIQASLFPGITGYRFWIRSIFIILDKRIIVLRLLWNFQTYFFMILTIFCSFYWFLRKKWFKFLSIKSKRYILKKKFPELQSQIKFGKLNFELPKLQLQM